VVRSACGDEVDLNLIVALLERRLEVQRHVVAGRYEFALDAEGPSPGSLTLVE
jgi:hypothetical protein